MIPDALVIGGGPAGTAAARLLALWGHRVALVSRSARSSANESLAESLPPSCGKLFDVLGVRDAIDRAGFIRSTGNTVWWGSDDARVEAFAQGQRGWQIDRARFAEILLPTARDAGVEIDTRETGRDAAPVILDCTGRTGLIARARGWRVYEPSLRTVALVGAWRCADAWPIPDATHTLIESYLDGWAWSVPLSDVVRHVAVMVDPRTTDLAKVSRSREVYLAEIAKTRHLAARTRGASLDGGPWGWDASMYSSTTYADDRVLLVGDAGSFIDPLSSAGVKKALASGWLAAVATHTALTRPAMRQTAFEFFAAREREMYARFKALTQRFLGDAAVGHAHPFWADRAEPLDGVSSADLDPDALRRDPSVRAAFERIRAAPSLTVRRGDAVRIEPRPAIAGNEIVLEPRLVAHPDGTPVRYLADVDVVKLLELAPVFDDVGGLFEAYGRHAGPVALPDFLLVLSIAVEKGWLIPRP